PAGSTTGLAPAMRAALARAEQLLGEPVPITSGFRSTEKQAALYADRANNPYPVAAPGSSMHERGLAIDVPVEFVPRLLAVAPKAGLCHPYPVDDPIHFEVCR
ncbi:MAG: M15 family metallopeptidase, partial [Actinomycetota bacterium]|nr:M15 family metallopeptidase [Actinomycetota bacterium]